MNFQMKIYINRRIRFSKISEKNGITGLSVWNCFRYEHIMLATSTKNCNFTFINTSVWWVTKVSYELFLLGCFDLHKVWKCFMTFTAFSQTSIARMATCSSSTQCVRQNNNGKTSEVFNWMYRSLRAGESLNSCHMAFETFSNFQPLVFMPVWKAPWTTYNPHDPTSIIWGNSFSVR